MKLKEVDSKNNKELYESEDVLKKYSSNSTRTRSLNNSETSFIDMFDVKGKNILVVGCGAGRVPSNMLLYGNNVIGIDRSNGMILLSKENFPEKKFPNLKFINCDATDLSIFKDEEFDVVFFPQNGIDYIENITEREVAIKEMCKKIKKGGILAFSSHNKLAYLLSTKLPLSHHSFKNVLYPYVYAYEKVVGGGYIFKGNPKYIIKRTEQLTRMKFIGYTCDVRGKVSRLISKNMKFAQFYFPYINYIFKKV